MGVIICYPRYTYFRRVMRCGACKRRRRMVVAEEGWYGFHVTCCACGYRRHSDGPVSNRSKRERAKRAAEAKAIWPTAHPPSYFDTYLRETIGIGADGA